MQTLTVNEILELHRTETLQVDIDFVTIDDEGWAIEYNEKAVPHLAGLFRDKYFDVCCGRVNYHIENELEIANIDDIEEYLCSTIESTISDVMHEFVDSIERLCEESNNFQTDFDDLYIFDSLSSTDIFDAVQPQLLMTLLAE
jgi:hypothetical protein